MTVKLHGTTSQATTSVNTSGMVGVSMAAGTGQWVVKMRRRVVMRSLKRMVSVNDTVHCRFITNVSLHA